MDFDILIIAPLKFHNEIDHQHINSRNTGG